VLLGRAILRSDCPHLAGMRMPDLGTRMTAPAFHIRVFNLVATLRLFSSACLDGMARLLKRLLPNRVQKTDPSRPRYLDESAA